MNDITTAETQDAATPIAIHTEHGTLHGVLALPPDAGGLIVLAHAGATPDARHEALAGTLREAGMGTVVIDLLTQQEDRFADVHNNVPLLAKRLLDCLALLKRQMQNDELPALPIGLYGTDTTSPVVIRVAALRDHDISAVVCRDGLIDLAGMLYLRSLESPLLVLLGAADGTLIASNRRALNEVACVKMLTIVPATSSAFESKTAFATVVTAVVDWFGQHCRATAHGAAGDRR